MRYISSSSSSGDTTSVPGTQYLIIDGSELHAVAGQEDRAIPKPGQTKEPLCCDSLCGRLRRRNNEPRTHRGTFCFSGVMRSRPPLARVGHHISSPRGPQAAGRTENLAQNFPGNWASKCGRMRGEWWTGIELARHRRLVLRQFGVLTVTPAPENVQTAGTAGARRCGV